MSDYQKFLPIMGDPPQYERVVPIVAGAAAALTFGLAFAEYWPPLWWISIGIAALISNATKQWLIALRFEHVFILDLHKSVENIYVVSDYPNDRTLLLRASLWKQAILLAKNETGIEVLVVGFAEGGRVNENWQEYQDFILSYVREDRAKRHATLFNQTNHYRRVVKMQY